MAIKQVTVFVENRQGRLAEITKLLAKNGIDMRALSIADTQDFGILRLIVNDTEKALNVLHENGVLAQTTEVIGVKLSDKAGELASALLALDKGNINVEYLYAFLTRSKLHAYVVLRVKDNEAAEKILVNAGFSLITEEKIQNM